MKNFTKTFKIGEVSHYDIIKVTVDAAGFLLIQGKNFTSTDFIFTRLFNKFEFMQGKPHDCLTDITTSYHADRITETIDKFYLKLKIKFNDL